MLANVYTPITISHDSVHSALQGKAWNNVSYSKGRLYTVESMLTKALHLSSFEKLGKKKLVLPSLLPGGG